MNPLLYAVNNSEKFKMFKSENQLVPQNNTDNKNQEKKIFRVFHKIKRISVNVNKSKNIKKTFIKCLYCTRLFKDLYGFDIHMKRHVSNKY